MKPKPHIQIEVDALSKTLLPVSESEENWAIAQLFKNHVYKTAHQATCFICGHTWYDDTKKDTLLHSVGGYTCPHCKTELTPLQNRERHVSEVSYFNTITTCKNYQLIRIFHIMRSCKVGRAEYHSSIEVAQHWIREDGQSVVRAMLLNGMSYNRDAWCFSTSLEVRWNSDKYYVHSKVTLPGSRFLKVIRRNGFKGSFHGWHPAYFCKLILTEPKAETLLKAKQFPLFVHYDGSRPRIDKYWQSIKICIRNNYRIQNADIWFDHLGLLEHFHKDIHNPLFICSPTLKKDHQRLINRKQKIEREKEIEERKRRVALANEKYKTAKAKFFDLRLSIGKIEVMVLPDVDDFVKEGELLKHCVFNSLYYEKEDSLILSARIGDQRLETIEVSLKTLKLLQSRGLNNKPTKYHTEIVKLVEDNIPTIKKLLRKRQKQTA